MSKLVVIQPNGLMWFAHHFEPKWKFWKKRLALTTQRQNAMNTELPLYTLTCAINCYPNCKKAELADDGGLQGADGAHVDDFKYYIVVCAQGLFHKTRYYDNDTEEYNHKLHRRISKPHFCKDINKAEFIKSRKYADEVATRCRQENNKLVAVREVYVYRENELLRRNIVVVLRHKENKNVKPMFLRSYDTDKGDFTKTSRYDQAARYTYDKFLDLYDNLHAVHKEYMILPKITDNVVGAIKAKDVDGKEMVEGTLRLKNK